MIAPNHGQDANAIFDFTTCIMEVVYTHFKDKLLAATADGCSTMMGVHIGVTAQLQDYSINPITIIWWGPHQIDIVLREFIEKLMFDSEDDSLQLWCARMRELHYEATPSKQCPLPTCRG
eukprot:GHVU01234981.1.p3 GENE.GHVU01234981.1~~GHVU01234981.1.p3  ORF type:complete len:120 (-),score=18.69 GHVU01234981.1:454-813(-)